MKRPAGLTRTSAAVTLLAAAEVAWAALPLGGSTVILRLVLAVAVLAALMILLSLVVKAARDDADGFSPYDWVGIRAWRWLRALPEQLPWAEILAVATIVLEALHPARPWHTVFLVILLTGFLLAYHLAESEAGPGLLRSQLPLLIAGAGLAVLCAAAAELPGGGGWLAALAGVAAVVVAGLVLPVVF